MKNSAATMLHDLKAVCLPALLLVVFGIPPECAAQVKKAANRDSVIVAAREIMGQQKYCALATVDSSGQPHVRTMNPFPPEDDMSVWMATNSRSRKVAEIRRNARVCLYYANHGTATGSVAISGRAVLVTDPKEIEKRKRDYWDQAFPDKQYLVLIKVVPEQLDVLNYSRGIVNEPLTFRSPSVVFDKQ